MKTSEILSLNGYLPLKATNAGLFISRGRGSHPVRVIDSHELIFVCKGRLEMFEEDRKFILNAGNTLLLWPGRKHGGLVSYPEDLSFFWIHFKFPPRKLSAKSLIKSPQLGTVENFEKMTDLFRRYIDDQETGSLNPLGASLMIMLMLSEIKSPSSANTEKNKTSILASRARTHIQTFIHENITTASIAESLKYNPDYLGRIFKETYGLSITDEIHRRKIQIARRLLSDSAMNIDEISAESGFNDTTYFRRVFRKITGLSPLAYRKLYARIHVNTE